jgi:hypothetical protein
LVHSGGNLQVDPVDPPDPTPRVELPGDRDPQGRRLSFKELTDSNRRRESDRGALHLGETMATYPPPSIIFPLDERSPNTAETERSHHSPVEIRSEREEEMRGGIRIEDAGTTLHQLDPKYPMPS